MRSVFFVVVGIITGLIVGIILHRGFGFSLVPQSWRVQRVAGVPASKGTPKGVLEEERRLALSEANLADLEKKVRAAREEQKDLQSRHGVAVEKAKPHEETRLEKIRRMCRIGLKMEKLSRQGSGGDQEEIQKVMGEVFGLMKELGLNFADPGTFFSDPEVFAEFMDAVLAESGVADEAARREYRERVVSLLSAAKGEPFRLRKMLAQQKAMLEFLDRFGEKFLEQDGASSMMSNGSMGFSSVSASSSLPKSEAVKQVASHLAKIGKLDEAAKGRIQPLVEAAVQEYALFIRDARQRYGDAAVDALGTSTKEPVPQGQRLARARSALELRMRVLEIQAGMVENVARQLPEEQAKLLQKFDTLYFFANITEP